MAPETPKDLPAPAPEPADRDPMKSTAEVSAVVDAADAVISAPNAALDVLVARDAAAAAEAIAPPATPQKPTTRAQEWGAAIVVMLLFTFIGVAFMSFLRD